MEKPSGRLPSWIRRTNRFWVWTPKGADYGWLFTRNDIITLLDSCFKLFFHQCPTGMQGSGFVIFCHCLCKFAALVGDSNPIFNACRSSSVAFPIQMLWMQQTGNYWEIHMSLGLGVQMGYWVGKRRNVLPDPLTATDPIPAWLSPVAGDDPTGGGPVVTADTRVRSYTAVHRNTFSGWIGCTLFAARSNSAACLHTTRRNTRWCHHLLPQQHCAQVLWNWPPSEPGCCLLASVRLHGHKPEPKPCCISMPVHRSSTCMPCTPWQCQIATVVEDCHDAGIGSDPHRRGLGVSFGLVPLFSFNVAPGPSEISSVPVTMSNKIWYSDILEIELGVQMYPGDCPGTDVHISVCLQWQVVQERGQTLGHVWTAQVWQF